MEKKELVLILTNRAEASVGHIVSWLNEFGQQFVRINTGDFLEGEKTIKMLLSKGHFSGFIQVDGELVDLNNIKSVWYRRPENPQIPSDLDMEPMYKKFIEDEFRSCLWSLYTSIDAFWMNHPLTAFHLLEHNKLYQLSVASSVGIAVPETIITNNPEELLAFCRKQGGSIAIKIIRSTIFQDSQGGTFGIYTNIVSEEQLIAHRDDIKLAPVMAQRYISKKLELRITVIGDKIFACAIHSQDSERTKHDWRHYDFEKVKHEPYQLPREIEEKLILLMRKWGLSFGAIDMILTPEGEYVFLEINPSGQFAWIEGLTGMPISKTIAETLVNPPNK